MIIITTHNSFLPEKEYVCKVIFNEILGIPFSIKASESANNYHCLLPNGNSITFADEFFIKFPEDFNYISTENIPQAITYFKTEGNLDIPVLYGGGDVKYSDSIYFKNIECTADIFASAFFMLTRWEELAIQQYDKEGRFDEECALAVKHRFIQLPLVNMYAELFKTFAQTLNYTINLPYSFTKTITCDIDFAKKWNSTTDKFKTLVGDIVKRKSCKTFFKNLQLIVKSHDPYNVINYFVEETKKQNNHTIFYLLHTPKNQQHFSNDFWNNIFSKAYTHNVEFGIHLNEYKLSQLKSMKENIHYFENILHKKITKNRQHFLRFTYPETLVALEEAGIKQDSSLYYRNYPGFRTGMCIEHSLFNVLTRKAFTIKELPLICMDVSLLNYSFEEAKNKTEELLKTTQKYNGNFVLLWHNSSFDYYEWKNHKELFSLVLNF